MKVGLLADFSIHQQGASVPGDQWTYDPSGKRMYEDGAGSGDGPRVTFYSITGQRLGTYQVRYYQDTGNFRDITSSLNLYFGGKLLQSNGVAVATDRLGSVRGNVNGEKMAYYPYGFERGLPPGNQPTAAGREKFGTYFQDAAGQSYADRRYYDNGGRFWSPDPYHVGKGTGIATEPQSWNRYAYVGGDPINFVDPTGRNRVCVGPPDDQTCSDEPDDSDLPGGGGGHGPNEPNPGIITEPPSGWDALSAECKQGLKNAMPDRSESHGIAVWLQALDRANAAAGTLQAAAAG